MTNEEKWANTLEKLHDIEPAPFNSNELILRKRKLYIKFMNKIIQVTSIIEQKGATEELLNKIEDLCKVYGCAVNNIYSYSIEDGKIKHPTEKGQKLADIFNN